MIQLGLNIFFLICRRKFCRLLLVVKELRKEQSTLDIWNSDISKYPFILYKFEQMSFLVTFSVNIFYFNNIQVGYML